MKALQRRCQDEILHDCAYVQHEIDRVRAEKRLGDERGSSGEDATTQWGGFHGGTPNSWTIYKGKVDENG